MAIRRYNADADTTITNAYKSNMTGKISKRVTQPRKSYSIKKITGAKKTRPKNNSTKKKKSIAIA